MLDVQFTSTISVVVVKTEPDYHMLRVSAPMFAWTAYQGDWQPDGKVEPIFYIDDDPQCGTAIGWMLRGAVESHSEQSWKVYRALLSANTPPVNAGQVLPFNRMVNATVRMNDLELKGLAEKYSSHPLKELRMIAEGFERLLADQSATEDTP